MTEVEKIEHIKKFMYGFNLSSVTFDTEDGFYLLSNEDGVIDCLYFENDEFEGELN